MVQARPQPSQMTELQEGHNRGCCSLKLSHGLGGKCCCNFQMLRRVAARRLCLRASCGYAAENALSGMQGRLSSAGSSFSGDIAGFSGASSPLGSYPSTPLKTPPRPAARSGLSRNSLSRTPSQVGCKCLHKIRSKFRRLSNIKAT